MIPRPGPRSGARPAVLLAAAALALQGCGTISFTEPPATPTDFAGITGRLNAVGIKVRDYVSGDPGCTDGELAKTAIRFTAEGLDQTTPATIYLYVFRNRDAFQRNLQTIGPCAQAYVTNPQTFEEIEQSPFVLASQGPWAPQFKDVLRKTIEQAAGTGD